MKRSSLLRAFGTAALVVSLIIGFNSCVLGVRDTVAVTKSVVEGSKTAKSLVGMKATDSNMSNADSIAKPDTNVDIPKASGNNN